MKRTIISVFLILVLAFSFCSVGFASVPEESTAADTRATSSMQIAASRESGTEAVVSINCNFAGIMDSYTITVYLQRQIANGSWVNDTTNDDYTRRVSGSGRESRLFDAFYNDLTRGTSYRVKVVSKTVWEGVTYTRTGYSAAF